MNTINDMQNRRDFLKTAAFAALGSGMAINSVLAGSLPTWNTVNLQGTIINTKLCNF